MRHECIKWMELRDLVRCYKSLQKLNKDCEKLRASLKELKEVALPIAWLFIPHPSRRRWHPLQNKSPRSSISSRCTYRSSSCTGWVM
jgi:hypothetical protein